jgi:hypothetical protein
MEQLSTIPDSQEGRLLGCGADHCELRLTTQRIQKEVNMRDFLQRSHCENVRPTMTATRFLHFLFASLISVALAMVPMATLGNADDPPPEGGMMQMAGISGDMPCCPKKEKQSGCQDCPLIAICIAKVLQSGPNANGLPVRETASRALRPVDEPMLAGLTRPPPDQPPRTNV